MFAHMDGAPVRSGVHPQVAAHSAPPNAPRKATSRIPYAAAWLNCGDYVFPRGKRVERVPTLLLKSALECGERAAYSMIPCPTHNVH